PVLRSVGPRRPVQQVVLTRVRERVLDVAQDPFDFVGVQQLDPVLEGAPERAGLETVELFDTDIPADDARRHVPVPGAGAARVEGELRDVECNTGRLRHVRTPALPTGTTN